MLIIEKLITLVNINSVQISNFLERFETHSYIEFAIPIALNISNLHDLYKGNYIDRMQQIGHSAHIIKLYNRHNY